jgi:hypothetical protein
MKQTHAGKQVKWTITILIENKRQFSFKELMGVLRVCEKTQCGKLRY